MISRLDTIQSRRDDKQGASNIQSIPKQKPNPNTVQTELHADIWYNNGSLGTEV